MSTRRRAFRRVAWHFVPIPFRWLSTLCAALLLVGAVGIVVHHGSGHGSLGVGTVPEVTSTTVPAHPVATTPPVSTTTDAASPAGPDTGYLEANMLTPTDMGGYYQIVPSNATDLLASAPCLAALQPAPDQSGRSTTALVGPDLYGLPAIVEVVQSYPGAAAAAVYQAMAGAISSCPSFSLDFDGTHEEVTLQTAVIPPVGDRDQVWQGTFTYGARSVLLQIGVALSSQEVVAMVYLDSVPASAAIMGTFPSTLSAAIGKLAQ